MKNTRMEAVYHTLEKEKEKKKKKTNTWEEG